MFTEERQQAIAAAIAAKGKITVGEIAAEYGISDESARRDLRALEQAGLCKRTRGGAILPTQIGMRPPVDRDFAQMPIFDNYREIAREALCRIRPGDTVYWPGGSFGHVMATLLPEDFRATVVVNHVDLAVELRRFAGLEVYVIGGRMRQSGSMVDALAIELVGRFHFDCCLLTGAGLTAEFGLSNGTAETAAYQRAVLANSRRRYLLMPGTKVGADGFIRVCGVREFDEVITDRDCIEEQLAAIGDCGVAVTVVEAVR